MMLEAGHFCSSKVKSGMTCGTRGLERITEFEHQRLRASLTLEYSTPIARPSLEDVDKTEHKSHSSSKS